MKENCFETQLRRVCKESPVQRIVINIERLHQAINIIASNKAPFHFKKNELDLRAFAMHRNHYLPSGSAVLTHASLPK